MAQEIMVMVMTFTFSIHRDAIAAVEQLAADKTEFSFHVLDQRVFTAYKIEIHSPENTRKSTLEWLTFQADTISNF
jgi:hypothetical protein